MKVVAFLMISFYSFSLFAQNDAWARFESLCTKSLTGDQSSELKVELSCKKNWNTWQSGPVTIKKLCRNKENKTSMSVDASKGSTDLGYDEYQGESQTCCGYITYSCVGLTEVLWNSNISFDLTCSEYLQKGYKDYNDICLEKLAGAAKDVVRFHNLTASCNVVENNDAKR